MRVTILKINIAINCTSIADQILAGLRTIISIVGASSVVAGGWFWLTQQYWLAIPLWLVGVAIILARKRMRAR